MRRTVLVVLAVCSACAAPRLTVVVPFQAAMPIDRVTVAVLNETGRELPMPQAGVIEQVVRVFTGEPGSEPTIADAFARAAATQLEDRHVRVLPSSATAVAHLRVSLIGWEVRDGTSAGGIVSVTADYRLLDAERTVVWEVKQDRLPVRLAGPNLSRYEVGRIATKCVAAAFASFPEGHAAP